MGLFDELCKPYSCEKKFYQENNIPEWECPTHGTKELGIIYKDENDGSYIKATVNPLPAQFWSFEVGCGESGNMEIYEIQMGSGSLSEYFPIMKLIASGMMGITVLSPK